MPGRLTPCEIISRGVFCFLLTSWPFLLASVIGTAEGAMVAKIFCLCMRKCLEVDGIVCVPRTC